MDGERMLYIITGASGSGKTACLPYLKEQLPDYEVVDFDDIGVPANADKTWRQESTEKWLGRYLAQDKPMVICGQMVIGEIISCPSFSKIDGIKVCLLDCSDLERVKRLKERGTYGANQDTLNWSAWLRMHHVDPTWEQHVIKEGAWEGLDFSKLESTKSWNRIVDDACTIDTSDMSIEQVAKQIVQNIQTQEHENIIYCDELSDKNKKKALTILRKNANEKADFIAKNNGSFAFVFEDDNKNAQAFIEGYCYYSCCYIDLLATEEYARNKGYASQLIQKAENLAKERGCLFMAVNTMDFEARPFYEKHGFKVEFVREGFEKKSKMYFLRKAL